MSHRPRPQSFWFHGNAVVFAGHLRAPIDETLEVLGATALPATGGLASATVDRFEHRSLVRFERGSSAVAGRASEHSGGTTYDTMVTSTIEGLDILGVVTADRVVARLVSIHSGDHTEPEILPLGSSFTNLRVAGVPVDLVPHDPLLKHGTYAAVAKSCSGRVVGGDGAPLKKPATGELRTMDWKLGEPSPEFEDRLMLTPLFDAVTSGAPAGLEASGPGWLRLAGFGTIYFGEYLLTRFSRRLTMVRVELGCPVQGTLVAGGGDINGHIYP